MPHLTKPRTLHTHVHTHMHKHIHTICTSSGRITDTHHAKTNTHITYSHITETHTIPKTHTHHTDIHIPCIHTAYTPDHRYIYTTRTTHTTHTHAQHICIYVLYTKHTMHHTHTRTCTAHISSPGPGKARSSRQTVLRQADSCPHPR